MPTDLTDISGIGKKTAESLRERGIDNAEQAVAAFESGEQAIEESSKRVKSGIRDFAIEQRGEVYDPFNNVRVNESNRKAVETFASKSTGSIGDAGRITRNNEDIRGGSLLELGSMAARGGSVLKSMRTTPSQQEISETVVTPSPSKPDGPAVEEREEIERRQARRNIAEMSFDAAANVSDFDRETIREANELRQKSETMGRRAPKTGFTTMETREMFGEKEEVEKDVRANAREVAAAKRVHRARSPEAKRVDSQRRADVTGDFDEWIDDPRRHDFPGVDTPERGQSENSPFGFTPDEQTFEPRVDFTPADEDNRFRLEETAVDGGSGQIASAAGEILTAPQEQQQVILSDLIPDEETQDEIGLEPRGADEEFFEFSDPLVRPDGPKDRDDEPMDLI